MRRTEAEKRAELKAKIPQVAKELGFTGHVHLTKLVMELDRRGIKPVRSDRWIDPGGRCFPVKLHDFLAWHLPELLDGEPITHPMSHDPELRPAIPIRPVGRLDSVTHGLDMVPPLTGSVNVSGWTVRSDAKGIWRAYKKLHGKTVCCYIGRDPSKAAEKIQEWYGRHDEQAENS